MTTKLVLENLKHKPMRSLLSILLIGVPVTLILSLVGISEGLSNDAQDRARGIGADVVIRGTAASSVGSFSGNSIDERYAAKIQEQPGVRLAMGVIVQPLDLPLSMMGLDMAEFNAMSGGFTYLSGRTLADADDILLESDYAEQQKKQVGDSIRLANHDWRVVGIIGGGKLAHVVVQKRTLQSLVSATGKVTVIYVKLDDPARTAEAVRQLAELLPNFKVDSMAVYTAAFAVTNIKAL